MPLHAGVLPKVVCAGSQSTSFDKASVQVKELAELDICAGRIERWTKRVGEQRVAQVESQAEAYQALPLPRAARQSQRPGAFHCLRADGRVGGSRFGSAGPRAGRVRKAIGGKRWSAAY